MGIHARECKSWNRPQEIETAKTQRGKDAEQQDRDNKEGKQGTTKRGKKSEMK